MAQKDDSDELLELAREFLSDESIQNAPRHEKIEFLREKGLDNETIERLLSQNTKDGELKTIHDTTVPLPEAEEPNAITSSESVGQEKPSFVAIEDTKPDVAPIITYPEFLLKPQKAPPLVTVSRLVNAAYVLAGVSALTWGASKYIVQPMLETLTEARHELADKTLEDLEKLNDKLEGMVSHVPYIASSAVKRQQEQDEDAESIDSDPTELFHRDVAVQTTPGLSRSSSEASLSQAHLDPTTVQTQRLSGLTYSLRTLVQSMEHANENEERLQKSVGEVQQYLTTLDSALYNSNNPYSTLSNDQKGTGANRQSEAQKFKQEIRSLKGAFLSSRNFPTAPRPAPIVAGYGSR